MKELLNFFVRNKISIVLFFFSLGLVFSYFFVDRIVYQDQNNRIILDSALETSKEREGIFQNFLKSKKYDLMTLRKNQWFQEYLQGDYSSFDNLKEIFKSVIDSNRDLMQVRFIDKDGQERIRIDRDDIGGSSYFIPQESLQNKSNRDYFYKSKKMPLEKIWYSKLELNRENNKLEVPFQPTLRAILPVSQDGNFAGIIVLNIFAEYFLTQIINPGIYETILVDEDGEILEHSTKNISWSRYKKDEPKLKELFPEEYHNILKEKIYRTPMFLSKHLDVALENNLILILKLKDKTISQYEEINFQKDMAIVFIMLLLSIVVSLLLSSFMLKLTKENKRIKEAEERLKLAAKNSKEFIYELNLKTKRLQWFEDGETIFGFKRDLMEKDREFMFSRVHEDDRDLVRKSSYPETRENSRVEIDYRLLDNDGNLLYLQDSSEMLFDANGNPEKIIGSCADITKRVENQLKLRQSSNVFENTNEGIIITDKDSKILDTNRAFTEITGYSKEEILGQKTSFLKSGIYEPRFYKSMWKKLLKEKRWIGEIYNRRKDGNMYPELLNISAVTNDNGEIVNFIAVFSDISVIKESEVKLNFLSHHDSLTGLPNKTLLKARIESSIYSNSKNLKAVLFLDLDNFKNVNDGYGHSIGDEVLMIISKRISRYLKRDDTVARIGGDDFIVFLDDVEDLDYIRFFSQKILTIINEPIKIDNLSFRLTGSIGISVFPEDGKTSEELIKNADTAMFKSKDNGKNTYIFYSDDMSESTVEKVTLDNEIQSALDNEEIGVYYQPQFNLQNGTLIGFEALARWIHPEFGFIPPDKFIPIAEETKMIVPIGAYILRKACEDMVLLEKEGLNPGRVAVNVSGVQIEDSNFIQTLKESIKDTGIAEEKLEIEVTESMMMKSPETWIDLLQDIRKVGIGISLDDFGTGYSSLTHLKSLPITTLKIDRSFVMDTPHDKNACSVASAIISLGESMEMFTLAEGIETEEQRDYFKKLGCKEAQGYYYSKPLKFEDAQKFLVDIKDRS